MICASQLTDNLELNLVQFTKPLMALDPFTASPAMLAMTASPTWAKSSEGATLQMGKFCNCTFICILCVASHWVEQPA